MANLLLHESSPYLLQHAHNPVNWRAWNDETLALAKTLNNIPWTKFTNNITHILQQM